MLGKVFTRHTVERERQQWLRKLFIRFALAYIHIKKEETKSIMQNYPFLSIVR